MVNWFVDKNKVKNNTVTAIMNELEYLIDDSNSTANYWLDETHNVFAFINDNGNDDKWIEIHYELYDNTEIIGNLLVLSTDNVNKEELLEQIRVVVNTYYGE